MENLKNILSLIQLKILSFILSVFNVFCSPFLKVKNKYKELGIFKSLVFSLLFIIKAPFIFIKKLFSLIFYPQIQVTKRIIEKSEKAKISAWVFPLFFFVLSFFTVSNAKIAIFAEEKHPVVSSVLQLLNGNSNVVNVGVSSDFLLYTNVISFFADNLARSLLLTGFLYYLIKFLLDKSVEVRNRNTVLKMIFLFIFFVLANKTFKFEINGFYYQKTYVEQILDDFFVERITDYEELATNSEEKRYNIKAVQVIEPINLYSMYSNFTNTYLLAAEHSKTQRNDAGEIDSLRNDTDTISIEYENNTYRVEFGMGGSVTKITATSPKTLNAQAELIGIDLLALENQFFVAMIQSIVDNTLLVAEKIKASDIERDLKQQRVSANAQDNQNVADSRLAFEHDYKTYCKNIYDYPLQADVYLVQRYIQVASMCASKAFLEEQYSNSFFDIKEVYAKNSELSDNYVQLFGDYSNSNTWQDVKNLTSEVCKTSYLLCAEAVQAASYINPESKKDLGLLVNAGDIVTQISSSIIDVSDDLLESRTYEISSSGDLSFKDYVLESNNALFNIKLALNQFQMSEIVFDSLDLIDFDKLFIPTIDEAFEAAFGGDPSVPFRRLSTCFYYPNQVKNGFKCEGFLTELVDLASANLVNGIALKVANTAISGLSPAQSLKKGATFGKGASNLTNTVKGSVAVGTAIVVPALLNSATKENQYSTQQTAEAVLITSYFLKYFNINFSGAIDFVANIMITSALTIYTIVFGLPFLLMIYVLAKITEIIIDIKILWLKVFTKTMDKGEQGVLEIYGEFVCELFIIALLIVYSNDFQNQLEYILTFKLENFVEIVSTMSHSIENFLTAIPKLLMQLFYELLMIIMINSFLIGLFDSISNNIKNSTTQQ